MSLPGLSKPNAVCAYRDAAGDRVPGIGGGISGLEGKVQVGPGLTRRGEKHCNCATVPFLKGVPPGTPWLGPWIDAWLRWSQRPFNLSDAFCFTHLSNLSPTSLLCPEIYEKGNLEDLSDVPEKLSSVLKSSLRRNFPLCVPWRSSQGGYHAHTGVMYLI